MELVITVMGLPREVQLQLGLLVGFVGATGYAAGLFTWALLAAFFEIKAMLRLRYHISTWWWIFRRTNYDTHRALRGCKLKPGRSRLRWIPLFWSRYRRCWKHNVWVAYRRT